MTKFGAVIRAPKRPRGSALVALLSLLVMSLMVLTLGAGTSGASSPHRAAGIDLADRGSATSRSSERPSIAPAPIAPASASAPVTDAVSTPPRVVAPVVPRTPRPSPTPAPAVEAPAPASFALHIAVSTSPDGAQAALDRCIGAVEIRWPSNPPEIAEHDFCGGAAFDRLVNDETVDISGGTLAGTYVVNGRRRQSTPGASSAALDGLGDVVLQTCVDANSLVLVGLTRIG